MSVKIDIEYDGELHCTAKHAPSGMTLNTDAPTDNGGKGETFSPTDLLATALGTCIITIMALVAQKRNISLKGTRVDVLKEMSKSPPRRVSDFSVTITYPADLNLSDSDKARLEKVVDACPVKKSLHPDVNENTEFIY